MRSGVCREFEQPKGTESLGQATRHIEENIRESLLKGTSMIQHQIVITCSGCQASETLPRPAGENLAIGTFSEVRASVCQFGTSYLQGEVREQKQHLCPKCKNELLTALESKGFKMGEQP